MFQVGRVLRLRQSLAAALSAVLITSLVVVAGVVSAPTAGAALVLSDCRDPGIFPAQSQPEAHNDGGPNDSGPDFVTPWNKPFNALGYGVLNNDGFTIAYTQGTVFEPKPERFRAILYQSPSEGLLTLDEDGSFVYTPKFRYGQYPLDKVLTATFHYVAYDPASQQCSDPTTVTIKVSGLADVAGEAPTASPDSFPSAGTTLQNNGTLTVPEPGVLANDFNNFSYALNDGLDAKLVKQPFWEGTALPAGTITNWGRQDLTPTPGGFTFTPALTGYGTAVFEYQACYNDLAITANACSAPVEVKIAVAPSNGNEARPFQAYYSVGSAVISYASFRANVTFDGRDEYLEAEFGTPSSGTMTFDDNQWAGAVFSRGTYVDPAFPGHAEIPYRMCGNVPTAESPKTCTNWATLTVVEYVQPPSPTVAGLKPPETAAAPVEVQFDSLVKGVTDTNFVLEDLSQPAPDGSPTKVPAVINCRSPYDPTFSRCDDRADTALLVHDQPLVAGHTYKVRLNTERSVAGIVAYGPSGVWLVPYEQTFVFIEPDNDAPTAAPIATAPQGTWTNHDVTVTWHWSDDDGSGIDPAGCTTTTTSAGEGVQTLTATCTDLAGNTGAASYDVKVDTTRPKVNVVVSPPLPKGGWYGTDVTTAWTWSDAGSGIDPARCDSLTATDTGEGLLLSARGCTDRAGNFALAQTSYNIDRTAPRSSPVVSHTDWTNQDVTVTWNWSDAASGIDPTKCPATSTFSAEGFYGMTESCTDVAGNEGSSRGVFVSIDKTAPTAAPTTSATGWSKSDVTVTWHWADDRSGLDATKCPATTTSTGEGSITVRASCTDLAGNVKNATGAVQVDGTAPAVTPTVTPNPVRLGGSATVAANATDVDGSGVASSSCGALSTTTLGAKTVQCTATDVAGNSRTASASYVVGVGVTWSSKPTSIRAKSGSTLSPSVQVLGANDKPISSTLAKSLPACTVKFQLGTQPAVCAVWVSGTATFGVTMKSTANLTAATTVPLVATVSAGTAIIGTATTAVAVTK